MTNKSQLDIEKFLFNLYYTPNTPAALSSINTFHTYIKNNYDIDITKIFLEKWLAKQNTYTLHKNRQIRFNRCSYNLTNIDDLWEMDLMDFQKISRKNMGFKYILAVIDCFSKHAWCIPIKSKTPKEVIGAFEKIFSSTHRRPITIQSDKGREFDNRAVRKFFKSCDIAFQTTIDPVTKASICERFIRTIKTIIYKYFTFNDSEKYVDVLDGVLCMYNNRKHSSIGMPPSEVNEKNVLQVWRNLEKRKTKSLKKRKYSIGDTVRVSNPKTVFEKGYKTKWSKEIFTIDDYILKSPVVYRLRDSTGAVIRGNFYECEIQKVDVH